MICLPPSKSINSTSKLGFYYYPLAQSVITNLSDFKKVLFKYFIYKPFGLVKVLAPYLVTWLLVIFEPFKKGSYPIILIPPPIYAELLSITESVILK